ncbi:ABC transporter permease [Fervidobacterium thailandense]|uniref:ABC transporter permease n=1 Tax=Fervidobacterium thailandense TaxID=1008305 RepID=A0A1E3G3X4_9BACT|nr:ABC transporter permease [Fervidobacterium thailandense]ODN30513.1 ABC transporter permease [Fervidobacterium thailandense]
MRKNYLVGFLLLLGFWLIISLLVGSDLILPTPITVFNTLVVLLKDPRTYQAILSTLTKILVVLIATLTVGVSLGFIIGLSDKIYQLFRPAILVIQAVPIITWLALVMFAFGIGWLGPVVVSVLSLFPHVLLTTAVGVRSTDVKLKEMAMIYNVPKWKIVRDIYLGSVIPQMVAALQVVMGNVWKVVVVAEYMCGDRGIGVMIAWARQSVAVDRVYAYTAITVIVGLVAENILNRYTRALLKEWEIA